MSTAAERLEYAGARLAEGLFSALPPAAGSAIGTAAGWAARRMGVRGEVVRSQIAASFPERSPGWVEGIAAACYRHFGREIAALAGMSRLDPRRLVARTRGTEELRRALAGAGRPGGGCIVVTGHLGNWELAGALVAGLDVPVVAVVKPQANRRFDRRLQRLRARLGIETVSMAHAARRVPEVLAAGSVVALAADQDAGSRGVFVPFLGRPASTFRGPAHLALRTGAPLLFGSFVREEEGYRVRIEVVEPPRRSGDPGRGAERALTAAWVARLEAAVRERPGQYFWLHRRWKTRPPGTGGGGAGTDAGGAGSRGADGPAAAQRTSHDRKRSP